jgi:hypothetical protein
LPGKCPNETYLQILYSNNNTSNLSGSAVTERTQRLETTEMRFIRAIEDYRMEANKINEDITE